MTMPTTLRRVFAVATAVVAAMLTLPYHVQAHTDFDYSLPADGASVDVPVDEITVAFTLPVTLVGNGFAVLDPQNDELTPVALTDDDTVFRLPFDPPLAGGTVAVKYEVRAEDGHVLTGSFVFVVEAPPPTTATTTPPIAPTTAPMTAPPTAVPPTTAPAGQPATVPADVTPATTAVPSASVDAVETALGNDEVAGSGDGDGSFGGRFLAIAVAVAIGAGGFLLIRSRTSGA